MSVYRFNDQSIIDRVTIQRSDGGGIRAYLHARENADPKVLSSLKQSFTDYPMQWAPTLYESKPTLELRGFGKNENELLRFLRDKGAVQGSYRKEPTVDDKTGFWDRLKANTLRASGLAYLLGDLGFAVYGWKEAFDKSGKLVKPQGIVAGVLYAVGSPFITLFGRGDKSDFQLKDISYNAVRNFEKSGFIVPEDSSLKAVANGHNAGALKKLKNFCTRYPAEIANSLFGLAGSMIIWTGIKELNSLKQGSLLEKTAHSKKSIWMDIGLGSMTVLAGLISVFVEEEVPNPTLPRKTGLAGIWQKIKERPLAAASGALMVSTLSHAGSTINDWKTTKKTLADSSVSSDDRTNAAALKKSLPFRGVFVLANLVAEGLMAVSSKGHGHGVKSDSSVDQSVYSVMADLVQRQPAPNQEKALEAISQYLSFRRNLGGDPKVIKAGIQGQLSALQNNPWSAVSRPQMEPERETSIPQEVPSAVWQKRQMERPQQPAFAPAMG